MRDQGYTPREIEDTVDVTNEDANYLLRRSVTRLIFKQKNMNLLPKTFDSWRKFVKIRKLVRHITRNMENYL
jgi:hypothetical protein